MEPIKLTLLGQATTKSNRRRLVTFQGRPRLIKSAEALRFKEDALRQIPAACRKRLKGPVAITLRMFYTSERPDLSEDLVLDVLQTQWRRVKLGGAIRRVMTQPGIYENDRAVREKHVFFYVDRINPRVEIEVTQMDPQQGLDF